MQRRPRPLLFLWPVVQFLTSTPGLHAESPTPAPIPPGYVLAGDSSPDGLYRILLKEPAEANGSRYLVDQNGKILTSYPAKGSPGALIEPLLKWWPRLGEYCIAMDESGSAFRNIKIIEAEEGEEPVVHDLDGEIEKKIGNAFYREMSEPLVSFDRESHLARVQFTASDHPLGVAGQTGHLLAFSGIYDLRAREWWSANTAEISLDERNTIERSGNPTESLQADNAAIHARLDTTLNSFYAKLKALEEPNIFATLQSEQRKWLSASVETTDLIAENRRLNARNEELASRYMNELGGGFPEGYIVAKGTTSPDGRYGVLILGRDAAKDLNLELGAVDRDDRLDINYLADLKKKKVLASFNGIYEEDRYFWLNAEWAEDGSWCLAKYGFRSWYEGFVLIQLPEGKAAKTTELCDKVTGTVGKDFSIIDGTIKADADGRVFQLDADASDNPREFTDQETHRKIFRGRYDTKTNEWLSAEAKPVPAEEEGAKSTDAPDSIPAWYPKGYVLQKSSVSPDRRYGILILSYAAADKLEDGAGFNGEHAPDTNYLADLKEGILLTTLTGTREAETHYWIDAEWTDDSSWCLVNNGIRWGTEGMTLIRPQPGKKPLEVDVLEKVASAMGKGFEGRIQNRWFAADASGKLFHLYLLAKEPTTGPDGEKRHFKAFGGSYDLITGQWLTAKATVISDEEEETLEYRGLNAVMEETTREWHDRMDKQLNRVYALLERKEKPEAFAKLREEQREWLAAADNNDSLPKKNVRLATRLHELRDRAMRELTGG